MLIIERSGLQGVFFIPAGITVAFLLRLDKSQWWIVLAAAGLTEAGMDLISGYSWELAAGFAAANVLEPLVGALIVRRVVDRIDLARTRDLWWFVLGAMLVSPALGATVGAATDLFLGGDDFLTTFWQWWLGDALGVVLIGAAILVWGSSPDRRRLTSPWAIGLLAATGLLTIRAFTGTLPLMFLVLIAIVAAGLLIGVRAVALTALLVAVVIAVDVAIGVDTLLVGLAPPYALVVVKLQLTLFGLTGLVVAAESYERELATSTAVMATTRAQFAESERRMERQIALRLQEALLPRAPLSHPQISVAARYEAGSDALVVGGDWYDLIDLPGGNIGISVGDVVGHGLEATTAMGRLRTAVAALAPHTPDPGAMLTALDNFAQNGNGARFATTAYAILEPDTGRLRYASAGHPPMLVVDEDGDTRWLMGGRSAPLLDDAMEYRPEATTYLDPGSLLICYTDGLIERRGESLDDGLTRLEQAAKPIRDRGESEICDRLLAEMGVATRRADDVVLVVVRYEPSLVPTTGGA
jgi:serine phosphatase RsbU (regulator of sigma subunit)